MVHDVCSEKKGEKVFLVNHDGLRHTIYEGDDRRRGRQKEKDDAIMNFVSRQAQEAILDPNLPESYKDEILNVAIKTLLRIAEKRNPYDVRRKDS